MKVKDIFKRIKENSKGMEFLPSGFPMLDDILDGGFLRKELVVVGAFTGTGKSYFAGQIAMNLALSGFKVMYFSTEISNETVLCRMLGALSNIKSTRVMAGLLSEQELENLNAARAKMLANANQLEFFDDIYELTEIQKLIKEHQPEMVIIDFVQNVFLDNMQDEYSRLSKITLELQKLAKEANTAVFILSQLSNMAAKKTSHEILEYKGSGNIATVADLGFIIERQETIAFKLMLQKNRRGQSGSFINFDFKQPGGWIHESKWMG
jgi:replicative DNA helicase